ncbi:MAG: type II toxin-antitoxin system RelE/ParE family toxin [Chlamydiota bacterium]
MPPVFLTKRAMKNIKNLAREDRVRCAEAVRILSGDPLRGEMLLGEFKGLRRYRVGALRIVYRLETQPPRVLIIAVGHRREVYR